MEGMDGVGWISLAVSEALLSMGWSSEATEVNAASFELELQVSGFYDDDEHGVCVCVHLFMPVHIPTYVYVHVLAVDRGGCQISSSINPNPI